MPNEIRPIIFLDFDGVICSPRAHWAQQSRWFGDQRWLAWADPVACDLVKRLCVEHGAELVISSTWRTMKGPCYQVLGRYKLDRHLHTDWRTNEAMAEQASGSLSRPWEINDWLSRNGEPEFIILDDDSFAWDGRQLDRWIKTDSQEGMSFAAFVKAEERLKAIAASREALRKELIVAEEVYRRSKDAMDASSLGGRSRTENAWREVDRLRKALAA